MEQYYIKYLNAKDNFRPTQIQFSDYKSAINWGYENLENFHIDMIKFTWS